MTSLHQNQSANNWNATNKSYNLTTPTQLKITTGSSATTAPLPPINLLSKIPSSASSASSQILRASTTETPINAIKQLTSSPTINNNLIKIPNGFPLETTSTKTVKFISTTAAATPTKITNISATSTSTSTATIITHNPLQHNPILFYRQTDNSYTNNNNNNKYNKSTFSIDRHLNNSSNNNNNNTYYKKNLSNATSPTKTNYDGGTATDTGGGGGGGTNFRLFVGEFEEYFFNYIGNNITNITNYTNIANYNNTLALGYEIDIPSNCSLTNSTCPGKTIQYNQNYWALILIIFPFLTLFGNVLVILAVCRERSLQTITNYFIVSLAIADLLVAVLVMPFAVYVLVNGAWTLPNVVCDFYIAMDVMCSTSSIFNLVAISIDRFIAVTQPIRYAKHKNNRRVCVTIIMVWTISVAIGSPIVLGLNNTPLRVQDLCVFYNDDFIVYSSLSSFYIPCIIMVFLYWNIFKALRTRARKQRAARKPHLSELITAGSVIENTAQTRRLAETTLDSSKSGSRIMVDDQPTNTASGSNEEDDENAGTPDVDDCHVIVNDKSTEFMLATVVEEAGNVVAQITSPSQMIPATDPNGNHDSGYAPSNIDDNILVGTNTPSGSLKQLNTIGIDHCGDGGDDGDDDDDRNHRKNGVDNCEVIVNNNAIMDGCTTTISSITSSSTTTAIATATTANTNANNKSSKNLGKVNDSIKRSNMNKRNGVDGSPKKEPLSVSMKPLSFVRYGVHQAFSLARNDSTLSTNSRGSRKEKKNSQASRFTIYKVHKASKKKREKSSAKKERKATKTLAIVLGVFLICWVPFFTCNIMDAMCTKFDGNCQPGVTAFILTTWLGYMNSFVNPIIYTIFNPEFRKAFKRIMNIQ